MQGTTALTTIPAIAPGERRVCVDAVDPSEMLVELGETELLVDAVINVGDEVSGWPVGITLESQSDLVYDLSMTLKKHTLETGEEEEDREVNLSRPLR